MSIELLRSDSAPLLQKKAALEKILHSPNLGEVRFHEFYSLAQKLPDFDDSVEKPQDEDIDVPIQFEEDAADEVDRGEASSEESEARDEESEIEEKGGEPKRQPSVVVDDDGNESVVVGLDGSSRSHRSGVTSSSFIGTVASEAGGGSGTFIFCGFLFEF